MKHVIENLLKEDCQLNPGRLVLVGVSGGADSLCLLNILLEAGYPLVVVHVNHQLRPRADADMHWVRQQAESRGLLFISQVVDAGGVAAANGIPVEEAARILRYQFLFEQAGLLNAQGVAVGHTADDQAETVLMNCLRGSGLNGLKGMHMRWLPNAWSSQIPLVRPLLLTWRRDTERYCRQHDLEYLQDESNQDTRYRRNLIRHEVIPYLERINPQLKTALVRMAQTLSSDQQIVELAVQKAWEECILEQQADWVVFNRYLLNAQPVEMRRQLMRRSMALGQPGLRDVDFESVRRAAANLEHPSRSGECNLIGGMRMLVEESRVWVANWNADLPGGGWPQLTEATSWKAEHTLSLPGGWFLLVDWVDQDVFSAASANVDPFQAYLDVGCEAPLLVIRPRRQGDRYQPLGMADKSLKISDYMINQKIPRRARIGWPLVCWQGQVVWIPGGAPAHSLRVQKETPRALRLRLARSELV